MPTKRTASARADHPTKRSPAKRAGRAESKPAPAKAKPVVHKGVPMSRADRAWIARLEKKGLLISGPLAGTPLREDDEILQPGPPCPGAVDAFSAERREGP